MKKLIIKTIIFTLVLSSIVFVMPQFSFAEEKPTGSAVSTGGSNLGTNLVSQFFQFQTLPDLLNSAVGAIANLAMAAAGYLLSISAYLLDVSINLTLNIKAFVEATPAVYSVWRILRDITGLFFIFYLLYAAIQMMIGFGKGSGYASTVKNIVIAGILINFSFFIVSVSIDFSNVISQAIYNAMIPDEVVMRIDPNANLATMVGNAGKSNISNIFMNSLRIQQIYDTNGNRLGTNIADPVKTALIGLAGVIMMITTAASFTLAALAFIARLIILIFLLAFSSLWFVGWIIPEVNKHTNKIQGQLFSQLLFMPVYLLLMYVGLTVINGSKLLEAGSIGTLTATGTNWIMPYVLIMVNFAIVIIILNLPLTVALGMGGMATGWLKKSIDKWDAQAVWKNIGGWTGVKIKNTAAYVPQNIVGQSAYLLGKSKTFGKIAGSSPVIGTALSKGLNKVSSATFGGTKGGYEGALKARKKDLDATYKKLGDNSYKKSQEEFRTNLPKGILGHVISSRANKEVSEKLIRDAEKKNNKEKKPENIKRLAAIERDLSELERGPAGFAANTQTREQVEEKQKRKEALLEEKSKIEKDIQEATELENADRDNKILSKIDDLKEKNDDK